MENYNKQNKIIEILESRIRNQEYLEKLPKSKDLAAEFKVNFKTIDKALNKIAKKGLILRRRRAGTLIIDNNKSQIQNNNLIETLFIGSTEISLNPYYSEIWKGLLDGLSKTKYKLVLTMLEGSKDTTGLKKICREFTPSVAKILIGTNSPGQIDILKKQKEPFILVGEKPYDNTPAVHSSIFKSLKHVFKKLSACGHKNIAYIGFTQSHENEIFTDLGTFYAYISALKDVYGSIDYSLVLDTPSLADKGYSAMKSLLKHSNIDAVYVEFPNFCNGVYRAIKEHGLNIPDDISVLSSNASNVHLSPELFSLEVDAYQLGLEGAKLVRKIINNREKSKNIKSVILEYEEKFFPGCSIRFRE